MGVGNEKHGTTLDGVAGAGGVVVAIDGAGGVSVFCGSFCRSDRGSSNEGCRSNRERVTMKVPWNVKKNLSHAE